MKRLFTPAEDAYLAAEYSRLTIRQMAAVLGRSTGSVQWHCDQFVKADKLDRNQRHYNRSWTDDEDDHLSDYWGKLPDAQVALALGRTAVACKIRALRGLGITARDGNLWTARAVGRLFGVDAKTVRTWVSRGWLEARRSPVACGRHQKWDIDEGSIEVFIRGWPYRYRWQRMEESYYRNLAERVWRADPYLTLEQIARAVGWQQPRVERWVKRGFLPSVRRPRSGSQAGPWAGEILVRRSELAGFVERVAAAVHANRSRSARERTLREGGCGRRRRGQQETVL